MALTACLMLRPAFCQIPTIEELEKRIEEAKKAKEEKRPAQTQGQPQRGDDGAAAAKHATPVVRNDVATEGEQRRAQIAAAQDEERRREEPERAATAKRQKGPLDHVADGLLRDGRGVIWSASDNGRDVSWDEADRYCTHRGMRLPSVAQLQSLVDRNGAMTTPCQAKQCKISGQFHLTGYRFWSRQFEGGRWAVFVHLDNGRRSFDSAASRDSFRALCVRGV